MYTIIAETRPGEARHVILTAQWQNDKSIVRVTRDGRITWYQMEDGYDCDEFCRDIFDMHPDIDWSKEIAIPWESGRDLYEWWKATHCSMDERHISLDTL